MTTAIQAKQYTKFLPSEFPAAVMIQPALDEAGMELGSDYEGTSFDPFLAEAFSAAIIAGNTLPFTLDRIPRETILSPEGVRLRFGLDERTFKNFTHNLRLNVNCGDRAKAHYAAAGIMAGMHQAEESRLTNRLPIIMNAWTDSHKGNPPGFMRTIRLAKLLKAVRGTKLDSQFLANGNFIFASYNDAELDELLKSYKDDAPRFALAIRMAEDKYSVDEVRDMIDSLPLSVLEEMYK